MIDTSASRMQMRVSSAAAYAFNISLNRIILCPVFFAKVVPGIDCHLIYLNDIQDTHLSVANLYCS
jgi:hypothetical protein